MGIPETRRVARVSNHGNVDVVEVPLAKPEAGEMVVQVTRSLISPGTELQGLRNPRTDIDEIWNPFGYQNSGIVADPNGCPGFEVGDRVSCLGIRYAQHSNWSVVPQHLVVKISDVIDFEAAAFTGLLGTALQAVRRADLQFGEYVAVAGLGILGQLICQIATTSGAHVIGYDHVEMRQKLASELGAEAVAAFADSDVSAWKRQYTRGYGLDAGIVAFGGDASAVLLQMANAMKKSPDTHSQGRVVIVGVTNVTAAFPAAFGNMDIRSSSRTGPGYHDKAWERGDEYPEALVPWNTRRNLEECFLAIEAGRLKVHPLITHRVGIDDVPGICRHIVEHPDEALAVIVNHEI